MAIKGELVNATTADGLTHHGLLFEPPDGGNTWVIHVHGSCSNFYQEPFTLPLAESLTASGISFLTVNTRGHDAEAYVIGRSAGKQREGWLIGSRRDIFTECVHDLAAWIALARDRHATRIVLSGHSAGAAKIAHIAARPDAPAIAGLVLLSPGDLLCRNERAEGDASLEGQLTEARELIADDPAAMRPGRFLSAAAFLSIFDNLEAAGVFAFCEPKIMAESSWPKLTTPALAIFGAADAGYTTPIEDNVELLHQLRAPGAPLECNIFPNTDHYFAGKEDPLAKLVVEWVRELQ
ncbi:MAG: alpha/beta hydrolase family protein [Planctomycetota bacterium]|jgi:pimeloyl-ACP methyl ester carboxylesterase